ncbi:MAG: ParM/StbA family protein [Chloroflexi bacterium]|nr:ParM/StbA family protein [Chloroflexota bacterium]
MNENNKTVRTETLPEGALFVGNDDVLYQVVMAGNAGFRKAEPWPWLPRSQSDNIERPSPVALVPGSLLARNYPLMAKGALLPTIDRANTAGTDGQPSHYLFYDERLARLAAQLDEILAHRSGLAARKDDYRWILGDGHCAFRVYHYQRDSQEIEVDLGARLAEEQINALSCEQGPYYWQYIPIWKATPRVPVLPLQSSLEHMNGIEAAETVMEPVAPEPTISPKIEKLDVQLAADAPSEDRVEKVELVKQTASAAPSTSKSRRTAMILSIDIGYGYTKGVGPDDLHFSFPSVIGTAEDIRFATDLIRGGEERVVKYGNWRFFYGEQAVLQSRIQSAIFDRSRVHDDTYKMLFVAALVELTRFMPTAEHIKVVTGLPVDFFNDRPEVIKSFEGGYRITTDGVKKIAVESVFVAPQPFGSLFRELLNERGKMDNNDVEKGRIGIIDIGTFTTDFVVADELRYVQRLSGSIHIGWSKVINQVRQALADLHMLELMPYEVDRAIQTKEVRVRGKPISLEKLIKPAITDIRTAIIARARDLWGAAVNLDMILVSGGGGPHLYDVIHAVYPHARLLDNAFWANAEGFYRFGQRPATFEK